MQQQLVIHIIGIGEVGIRVINQLIRYESHYIAIGLRLPLMPRRFMMPKYRCEY